jgi:hypothetical protein
LFENGLKAIALKGKKLGFLSGDIVGTLMFKLIIINLINMEAASTKNKLEEYIEQIEYTRIPLGADRETFKQFIINLYKIEHTVAIFISGSSITGYSEIKNKLFDDDSDYDIGFINHNLRDEFYLKGLTKFNR